jgi:hypothetical protein
MEGNIYCLQCYAQISLVPLAGEDSGMPVNMMREQLAQKHGVDNVDELTMDEDDEDFDEHEDDDEVIEQFTPKYDSVWNLISAADALPDKCNFVGYRLLELRANKEMNNLSGIEKHRRQKEAASAWATLKKEAGTRTRRTSQAQMNNCPPCSKPPPQLPTPTPSPQKQKRASRNPPPPTLPPPTLPPPNTKKRHRQPTPSPQKRMRTSRSPPPPTLPQPNTKKQHRQPTHRPQNQKRASCSPPPPALPKSIPKKRDRTGRIDKQDRKGRKCYRKCQLHGCPVNSSHPAYSHIKYHLVPKYRKELTSQHPAKKSVVMRQGINWQRREIPRRMRQDPNDNHGIYTICSNHKFNNERKSVRVTYNGREWMQRFVLTLPEDNGPKSSRNESTTSKGLGGDREVKRVLDESNAIIEHALNCRMISAEDQCSKEDASIRPRKKLKLDIESEMDKLRAENDQLKVQNDILKGDLVESMVAHTQTIEQFSQQYTHDQHVRMNPQTKCEIKSALARSRFLLLWVQS